MSAAPIAHIRKRYPRSGGNSFRKSTATFDGPQYDNWTFCGAPITDRDLAWKQRNTKWTRENACPDCVAKTKENN